MEYLKCLVAGAIAMAGAGVVMMIVSCVMAVGMIGLEWFLGLFGGRIVLPPGVSRGTILEPIVVILFGLIVLPCLGWFIRSLEKLQKKVALLAEEKAMLANQIACAQREKKAMM